MAVITKNKLAGKKKAHAIASLPKVELDPDAWPKFEKLIKSAAKMGHRPQKEAPKKKK